MKLELIRVIYNIATWMLITPLSDRSIQMGSMSVEIPDFTNRKWCVQSDYE